MYNSLLGEYIGVHLIDMDYLISEQVRLNQDGSFSIFINARLNAEQQMLAYQHALMHIAENDFSQQCANTIEAKTHRQLKSYAFHNTRIYI